MRVQVLSKTLGSPPLEALLKALKPAQWCAGHMHIRFTAEVCHAKRTSPDSEATKFLALSKPGEGRQFLEARTPPSIHPHMRSF